MKQHWIKLLMVLMCWVPETGFGQEMPNVIPPSPEAASLGKFGEIPISHYTGVPNISVPITSVTVGDKSFPISLSYHSRGIQVSEIASRVGLGWALNAGGAITRKTMGSADDLNWGYYNGSNGLMAALADESFFNDEATRTNFSGYGHSPGDPEPDYYPDQYIIQVGGLSAKFTLDYNDLDNPLVQKYQDIHISYGPNGSNGFGQEFIVTDSDGYKYYFGVSKDRLRVGRDYDQTVGNYTFPQSGGYSRTSPTYPVDFYSSWKLMDIESPNGEVLSFFYTESDPILSVYYRRSYDEYVNVQGQSGNDGFVNYSSEVRSIQSHLVRIKHSDGEVLFEEDDSSHRLDLNGGYRLKTITVRNVNQSEVRSFDLYHEFKPNLNDDNQNLVLKSRDDSSNYRMFLDSIVEFGAMNQKKPAMSFQYNNQPLPNRFSNSVDLWGTYNGADNGQFLSFFNSGLNDFNRAVDTVKAQAGMLESIKYPTGGYTKFTYEHNKGKMGPEFADVVIPNTNPVVEKEASLGSLMYGMSDIYDGQYYESAPFVVGDGLLDSVAYNIWFGDPSKCSTEEPTLECDFNVYLIGTMNTYVLVMGTGTLSGIAKDTYYLRVEPKHPNHDPTNINNTSHAFGVRLNWRQAIDVEQNLIYASGKRIKKIEHFNGDGLLASFKEYDYRSPVTGGSSGKILGLSTFHSISQSLNIPGYNFLEPLGAIPGSPLSTYQGNTIGYEYVQEYMGDKNSNYGKTEYKFTIQEDTGEYNSFPYHPPTDNEWLRGLPLEVKSYKSTDVADQYKLVKSVENEYDYGGYSDVRRYTPFSSRFAFSEDREAIPLFGDYDRNKTGYSLPLIKVYLTGLYGDPLAWNYKVFNLTGGTVDNIKSKESWFDDNENITLVQETETEFNYQKHYKVASIINQTSDGKHIVQSFTYPQDIFSGTQIHPSSYSSNPTQALAEQHRFVPIEVKTFKDFNNDHDPDQFEPISTTKTTFKWFTNVLEPELIQTGKGTDIQNLVLTDRLVFDKYDIHGKLLQAHKVNGINVIYLYSYDDTLPVAKIETDNYDYDQFVTKMQQVGVSKNVESHLQGLFQDRISDAMITTYTYDPLIGMTSMTDPSGMTVYYEYDEFGRLKRTKDEDGKILTETEYQYGQ